MALEMHKKKYKLTKIDRGIVISNEIVNKYMFLGW